MGSFANDRKWALEKKNETAIKSMDIGQKANELSEKRKEMEEGISRIPSDLPEELQQQIDVAIENARREVEGEANEIEKEADDAKSDAEGLMQDMGNVSDGYINKAEKLRALRGVPLVGGFAEMKAQELDDQVEQMNDIYLETQQYADKLAESRNKLLNK